MGKGSALLLILVFLTSSLIIMDKPVSAASEVGNLSKQKAPMHQARSNLGVAAVSGKIYAIGGNTLSYISDAFGTTTGGVVGTNEEYDPATDYWTYKTTMPTARMDFAIAVYEGKIYCIGGQNATGIIYSYTIKNTAVNEVYDPATNKWETKAPMPTAASDIEANIVNSKIYIFTEANSWEYDPQKDTWTSRSPMPNPESGVSAAIDNKIYVISASLTQIYDPETDTWNKGSSPTSAITGAPLWAGYSTAVATTGVMAPKRIYALGSTDYISDFVQNDIYNPETDSWTHGAALPVDHVACGAAVLNDVIYAVGGLELPIEEGMFGTTYVRSSANEEYTPFGYGTIPPIISPSFASNATYNSSDVPLVFTLNKPVSWVGYSLDGKENVTITGNITLTGLANGLHNVTIYSNDTFGNMGTSNAINFTIAIPKPQPFPIVTVAAVSGAIAVIVIASFLVYFKKHRRAV